MVFQLNPAGLEPMTGGRWVALSECVVQAVDTLFDVNLNCVLERS
jgi:hypothetical protein